MWSIVPKWWIVSGTNASTSAFILQNLQPEQETPTAAGKDELDNKKNILFSFVVYLLDNNNHWNFGSASLTILEIIKFFFLSFCSIITTWICPFRALFISYRILLAWPVKFEFVPHLEFHNNTLFDCSISFINVFLSYNSLYVWMLLHIVQCLSTLFLVSFSHFICSIQFSSSV